MVHGEGDKAADPLGKRALFWVPSATNAGGESTDPDAASPTALPVGKRALYSGAASGVRQCPGHVGQPAGGPGSFTVECERCRQVSRIGLLDLLIYQFPVGGWLPSREV